MKAFILSLVALPLVFIILLALAGVLPGADGIVAQRSLPDGTLLLVTQTHGTSDLAYEVEFFFKSPKDEWRRCYLDHDDSAWRSGRIEYDEATKVATIWDGSTLRGRFAVHSKKWELPDVVGWVSNGPHPLKNPPFPFENR